MITSGTLKRPQLATPGHSRFSMLTGWFYFSSRFCLVFCGTELAPRSAMLFCLPGTLVTTMLAAFFIGYKTVRRVDYIHNSVKLRMVLFKTILQTNWEWFYSKLYFSQIENVSLINLFFVCEKVCNFVFWSCGAQLILWKIDSSSKINSLCPFRCGERL